MYVIFFQDVHNTYSIHNPKNFQLMLLQNISQNYQLELDTQKYKLYKLSSLKLKLLLLQTSTKNFLLLLIFHLIPFSILIHRPYNILNYFSSEKKKGWLGDTQIIYIPSTIRKIVYGGQKSNFNQQSKELRLSLIVVNLYGFCQCEEKDGNRLRKNPFTIFSFHSYLIINILPIYIKIPVPIIKYPSIGSGDVPNITSAILSPTMVHQPNTIRIAGTEYANIFIAGTIIYIPPYSCYYLKNSVSVPLYFGFSKQGIKKSENRKKVRWHTLIKGVEIATYFFSPHRLHTWKVTKKQKASPNDYIKTTHPVARYINQTVFSTTIILNSYYDIIIIGIDYFFINFSFQNILINKNNIETNVTLWGIVSSIEKIHIMILMNFLSEAFPLYLNYKLVYRQIEDFSDKTFSYLK